MRRIGWVAGAPRCSGIPRVRWDVSRESRRHSAPGVVPPLAQPGQAAAPVPSTALSAAPAARTIRVATNQPTA
jgi:hypothetical protein